MKKAIVVGASALLAACGGSNGSAAEAMPQECIDLLGSFLRKIEPNVSTVDWDKATLADFEAFTQEIEADSNSFDAEISAAGCNRYSLTGSDDRQFEQMAELAAAEAPGTVEYLQFLNSLAGSATATGESIPSDCAGTIAAVEEFLARGGSMQDLTMPEVTRLGQLMTGVSDSCAAEESSAFFAREDLTTYLGT